MPNMYDFLLEKANGELIISEQIVTLVTGS